MLLTYGVTRVAPDWHVTEPRSSYLTLRMTYSVLLFFTRLNRFQPSYSKSLTRLILLRNMEKLVDLTG